MCHILKGIYTWKTVHKTVLENATRLYFSTVRVRLFQSFVFFTILQFYNLTIRHNNSRLSKTCHQMSVTSSQSFFHLILFHTWFNSGSCPLLSSGLLAGSDPNAEASELGGKNGSLAVYQKIS